MRISWLLSLVALLCCTGCAPDFNRFPTAGESDSLTGITQLTDEFKSVGQIRLSPDMEWIAFDATLPGKSSLSAYVAPLSLQNGKWSVGRAIRVCAPSAIAGCPTFSPDGLSMVFSAAKASDVFHLYRADGWESAVGGLPPGGSIDLAQHVLLTGVASTVHPCVSPDGKSICYAQASGTAAKVWAVKTDGGQPHALSTGPGDQPAVSPDGQRLAFVDRIDQQAVMIATLSRQADGSIAALSGAHALTRPSESAWHPVWHPDGFHLVYTSFSSRPPWPSDVTLKSVVQSAATAPPTQQTICLMQSDGTHKTRLTFGPGIDDQPIFSADGHWLFWVSNRTPDKDREIFVARFRFPKGS